MTSSSQAVTHEEIEQALHRFLAKGGEIQVLSPNPGQELLLKLELRKAEVLGGGIPTLRSFQSQLLESRGHSRVRHEAALPQRELPPLPGFPLAAAGGAARDRWLGIGPR